MQDYNTSEIGSLRKQFINNIKNIWMEQRKSLYLCRIFTTNQRC